MDLVARHRLPLGPKAAAPRRSNQKKELQGSAALGWRWRWRQRPVS